MAVTNIEFKTTVWQKVQISPHTPANVRKAIDNYCRSKGATSVGLYEQFDEYLFTTEILHETENTVTPEDNGGHCTIEIKDEEDEVLWRNGLP